MVLKWLIWELRKIIKIIDVVEKWMEILYVSGLFCGV